MLQVPGIRSVIELLNHDPSQVKEVWIAKNSSRIEEILSICDRERIPIYYKDAKEISRLIPDVNHQGVVAIISQFNYSSLEWILSYIKKLNEKALIIALDHITDEGNLASILRTSAFFGVHGIILPKKRSASVSAQVIKRSAGACFLMPVAKVSNIAATLRRLKDEGLWIIGTSHKGEVSLYEFDWDRDMVLVLGNEQKGMAQVTEKVCDKIVKIPLMGKIESLNVGVAAGVFLSEITRRRLKLP